MKTFIYTFLLCIFCSSNVFSQVTKTSKPIAKTSKPVAKSTKPIAKTPVKKKTTSKTVKTIKAPVKIEPSFLLVKIKSDIFTNKVGAFGVRQGIEDKIDEQLTVTKNGEWISGDSGPGEINILYKVQDVETAKKMILQIVTEEKFEKSIFMGIRTFYEKGESKYKAIYPMGYKGEL